MLPQNAGVVVTSITPAPNLNVSMTLNINTMLGRNQINRIAHSTSNFYSGVAQSDQTAEIDVAVPDPVTSLPVPSSYFLSMPSPTKVLQVTSTRPITVVITVNNVESTIQVNKLFVSDAPISSIDLQNFDTANTVQAIITYLT